MVTRRGQHSDCARKCRRPGALFNEFRFNGMVSEFKGDRKADRTGADDKNLHRALRGIMASTLNY